METQTRDIKRDRAICKDYLTKQGTKYVAKVSEIALIYGISEIRVYQILKRNDIKLRGHQKKEGGEK